MSALRRALRRPAAPPLALRACVRGSHVSAPAADDADSEAAAVPQRTAHATTRGVDDADDDSLAALGPPRVHATAVVEPGAWLGPGVVVGPHAFVSASSRVGAGCVLGPGAALLGRTCLGARCLLRAHAVVGCGDDPGHTTLGARNVIGHHAVVGAQCPDLKFRGGASHFAMGDRNDVREHAALHRSSGAAAATRVGSRCLLMGGSHVGHDSVLGDAVIVANGVLLGGHVRVGSGAVLSGGVAAQQHVRVGRWAFVAGGAMLEGDVPACMRAKGDRAELQGVNTEGLRRAGWPPAAVAAAARAAAALYRGAPEGAGPATHAALAARAHALLTAPDSEFAALAAAHHASEEKHDEAFDDFDTTDAMGVPPALLLLRSVRRLAGRGAGRGPAAWRANLLPRVAALEAALAALQRTAAC